MNLFIIIFICPFYYAENKYFYIHLENIHENTLAKIDNILYYKFVSKNFEIFEEYLHNLESISLSITNPGNEYNCYFMDEILSIFHISEYIHFQSTFPIYEAEISRFLRPKICKILKQYNKSKISIQDFKNYILDKIKEEINNIQTFIHKTKINLLLSSACFFNAFYEKRLIKDEKPSKMHYSGKICNSNTKTLKYILMDELQFEFIKIKENETNFDFINVLLNSIYKKYTDFSSYNIYIYINIDISLLVLNYFLTLQQEHLNSNMDNETFLFKLLTYVQILLTVVSHDDIKKELEQYLNDKDNLRIVFYSDNFYFFFQYLILYHPYFISDDPSQILYFKNILIKCKELRHELIKIKFD